MKNNRRSRIDPLQQTLPAEFRELWQKYRDILLYAFSEGKFEERLLHFYKTLVDGYSIAEIDYKDGLRGFIFRHGTPVAAYAESSTARQPSFITEFLITTLDNISLRAVTVSVKDKNRQEKLLEAYLLSIGKLHRTTN